ncbi:hypothetical protein H310_05194 [Aphanomyces invadans]|uniref:Uncharacterized protein n=1 Tax=Aphanomyces invadans TaxID=157072 RepID=A0A024UDY3_9STRA|nr:hypothetical protein H310_05194 [Aphanomyces invadans]ETW03838.1 hypothetical protein H310_05194 [Aphanomyces invadans]|eukprot:XP_008868067.1 hypothetical protein H310_05194 [Aphanomyces invadans]
MAASDSIAAVDGALGGAAAARAAKHTHTPPHRVAPVMHRCGRWRWMVKWRRSVRVTRPNISHEKCRSNILQSRRVRPLAFQPDRKQTGSSHWVRVEGKLFVRCARPNGVPDRPLDTSPSGSTVVVSLLCARALSVFLLHARQPARSGHVVRLCRRDVGAKPASTPHLTVRFKT